VSKSSHDSILLIDFVRVLANNLNAKSNNSKATSQLNRIVDVEDSPRFITLTYRPAAVAGT